MAKTDGIWRQLDKGYIISTQVSIVQIPNTLELIEKSWKIKKQVGQKQQSSGL